MSKLVKEVDSQHRKFGQGWISGFLALILAIFGFAIVLCFCYPQILTVEEARQSYVGNIGAIRILLHVVLIAAFILALISVLLRGNKILGFTAMSLVLGASLMGGSKASTRLDIDTDVYLGLDFFLLNLIFLGAIFIPVERLLKQNDQPILRFVQD